MSNGIISVEPPFPIQIADKSANYQTDRFTGSDSVNKMV